MNNKVDMHKTKTNAINNNDSRRLQEVNAKNQARGTTSSFLHSHSPDIEEDIAYNNDTGYDGNLQEPSGDNPIGAISPDQEVTNPANGAKDDLSQQGLEKKEPTVADKAKEVAKKKAGGAAITYATGGVIHGKLAEEIGGKPVDLVTNMYKKRLKRKLMMYGIAAGITIFFVIGIIVMFISEGETNRNPSNIAICSLSDTNDKELKEYLYSNGYCIEENCQIQSIDDEGKSTGGFEDQASYTFFKSFRRLIRDKEKEFAPVGGFDSPLLYETIGYYRGDDELFQLSYHDNWFWWLEDFLTDQNKDAEGNIIDPDIANMTATDKEMELLSAYMYEWVKPNDGVKVKDIFYKLITLIKLKADSSSESGQLFLTLKKILIGLDLVDTITEKNFEDWWNSNGITYESFMLLDEFDRRTGSNLGADWLQLFGFKKVFSMNRYVGYLKYGKNLKQVIDKENWPKTESLEYTTETTYTGDIKEGYIYNRLKNSIMPPQNNDERIEKSVNDVIKQIYLNIENYYGCTKAICKPCEADKDNNGSTICSDISLTSTSLSRQDFIEKTKIGMASYSKEGAKKIADNAGLIYDISIAKNFNPELVVIRAVVEGFSPGGNNYWGLNCPNGADCSGKTYNSIEAGVTAFINVMQGYGTNSLLEIYSVHHYAYIGSYWFNPGGSGKGVCYYYPHIKQYMSSGRSLTVGNACAATKVCAGSGCLATNDEDQLAYSKFQVQKMLDVRKSIYNINSDNCDDGESKIVPINDRLKYLFPDGIPTSQADMEAYLTTITVPILNESGSSTTMTLKVHKKLAGNFTSAFTEIKNTGFKIKSGFTAAYVWKNVSGTSKLSAHSYGAAVDINWNDNPVCNTKNVPCGKYNPGVNEYSITRKIADILESHGLLWGLWQGSRYPNGVKYDYMHFSYTGT